MGVEQPTAFMPDAQEARLPPAEPHDLRPGSPPPALQRVPRLAWLPLPVLLALEAALYLIPAEVILGGLSWIPLVNLLLTSAASLAVAALAAVSYLDGGMNATLPLGAGMLAYGVSNLLANLALGGGHFDAAVGTANLGYALAGLSCLLAAARLLRLAPPRRSTSQRWATLSVGYGGVLLLCGGIAAAALSGALPPFFIVGSGSTWVRYLVLAAAAAEFSLTAGLLLLVNRRDRSAFLYWCALGLALLALGMTGGFAYKHLDSLDAWVVRAAVYLGGAYLLTALVVAVRQTGRWSIPLATLRETHQRYTSLVESSPDGILVVAEGRCVFANPAAARLFGVSPSERLLGRHLLDLTHPESRALMNHYLAQLASSGGPGSAQEVKILRPDGLPVEVELVGIRVTYEGQPSVQMVLHDLSERKRAEEESHRLLAAVREEKDRLSALVASIRDEVWFADAHKKVTLVNPAVITEFALHDLDGVEVEKFAARLEVYRPDGSPRPVEEAPLLRALRGEGVRNQEEIVRTPAGGQLRHRQVSAAPVRDVNGTIIGSVSVVRDITEQKKAEETLKASEARYRMLFTALEEGFLLAEAIRDPTGQIVDFRYLEVNPACERITGIKREQVIGRTAREVIPTPVDDLIRMYAQVVTSGQPIRHEVYESFLDQYHENYVFRPAPGLVAVLFWDVTERKRVQEALRESTAQLKRLYESGLIGVLSFNLDGPIKEANDRFLSMVGYTRDDLLAGRVRWDLMTPPEYRQRDSEAIAELKAYGVDTPYEKEYIRKDGSHIPILIGAATTDEERQEGIAFVLDLSERKAAEEKIESLARFPSENPNPVLRVDREGRLVFANPASQPLLDSWSIETGHFLPAPLRQVAQEVLVQRTPREIEIPCDSRIYLLAFYPIGGREYVNVYGRDISERKQAEEALRMLNATLESQVAERTAVAENRAKQLQALALQLTEAEERERRRISDLLHDDLQQLLSASRFHLSVLHPAIQANETAAMIVKQVDALLEDSIGKSRRLSQDLSPAILFQSGLPAAVERLAKQMQERHGLKVQVEVSSPQLLQNDLLRVFLYRCIQEMLFNVVKHAGVKAATVRLERLEDRLEVTVSDSGKGFDPGNLHGAGNPLQGFGLFGIRERIGYLGGRLDIESAPGKGSCLRLSIPTQLDQPKKLVPLYHVQQSFPPSDRAGTGKQARFRVLVVDDHAVMRQGPLCQHRFRLEVKNF